MDLSTAATNGSPVPSHWATLALIFVLAFLAETLTEYFAAPWVKPNGIPDDDTSDAPRGLPRFWLRYIAALVGIALAIAYRVDVFALFGLDKNSLLCPAGISMDALFGFAV